MITAKQISEKTPDFTDGKLMLILIEFLIVIVILKP
jgi:hypothetical protein